MGPGSKYSGAISLPGWVQDGGHILLVMLAYFAAHQIAFFVPDSQQVLAAVWPAGGIGLAALLLNRRHLWPYILLGMFLAGNIANLLAGRPLFNSLGYMSANVLESLACAWVITWWCGEAVTFSRVKEVLALVVSATLVNACTALVGAGTAALASLSPFWEFWETWLVADGLGLLIVTPLIITWAHTGKDLTVSHWKRTVEAGLFLGAWSIICWLTFSASPNHGPFSPQPYLLILLLTYVSLRFSPRGVATSLSILAIILISSKAVTVGPLVLGGSNLMERVLLAQMFIASVGITGYLLAAIFAERKQAEASLRETTERYRATVEQSNDGITIANRDGCYVMVNQAFCAMMGYTKEELLTMNVTDLVSKETTSKLFPQVIQERKAGQREVELVRKDGSRMTAFITGAPMNINNEIFVQGIVRDITERKQAEEALQKSEEKYRLLAETSNALISEIDANGKFLYVNPKHKEVLGYEVDEMIGHFAFEFGNPADQQKAKERLEKTLDEEKVQSNEWLFKHKSGNWKRFICHSNTYTDSWGKTHITVYSFDITERKQAEEQIRKSLAEKETLLRELYHRTKNNMGVVIALLELQAASTENESIQAILSETKNRVHSMALVHKKLYEAQNLSYINLKEYISDLLQLVLSSHPILPGKLSLQLDLDDIHVLIDIAIPCGLVLNELFTNIFKYAFPGERKGEITVQLHRSGNEIQLTVADDGVGFPPGFDLEKNGGLGLQLVRSLGEGQLDGKVTFDTGQGVTCSIRFQDNLYQPRV